MKKITAIIVAFLESLLGHNQLLLQPVRIKPQQKSEKGSKAKSGFRRKRFQ
jgi:hypothetical protein